MRPCPVAVALALLTALPVDARADEADVFRFSWTRGASADGCPSPEKVARQVSARLGRDPFDDGAARSIRGVVERSSDGWVVRVEQFDGDSLIDSRDGSSAAPDCAATLSLSAFLVTRLIETGQSVAAPLPVPTAAPAIAPPPPAPAIAPPPPAPAIAPPLAPPPLSPIVVPPHPTIGSAPSSGSGPLRPRLSGAMFLGGGAEIGLLPSPSPVVSFGGALGGGPAEASIGVLFLPEVSTTDGAFSFGMTAGWFGGCLSATSLGRASFLACGELVVGAIHAIVNDIDPFVAVDPGSRPFFALLATPRLRLSIVEPLSAEIGAHLVAPLTRHRFMAGVDEVFKQAAVAAIPFARLSVSFF